MWNILIVDDNSINRKLLKRVFYNMNVEVTEAKDGLTAVELCKENIYDMIFMDLFMPHMNGYETTKQIRDLNPNNIHIPIIATSAVEPEEVRDKVLHYGLNDIIRKPAQKVDVERILEAYLSFTSEDDILSRECPEIIDIKQFEAFYNDKALRQEIIETLLGEKEKDLSDIKRVFASKDCDTIYEKIHYLKGTFSYIKADKILKISQSILDFCKQSMTEEVLSLEKSFTENYLKLQRELADYLQTM